MKKVLRKNRIIPPLFFFISGILLADFTNNQWWLLVLITPPVGIIALFNSSVLKSALFLPLGILFIAHNTVEVITINDFRNQKIDVEGIVYKSLERSGTYTKISLDVDEIIQGKVHKSTTGKIIIYAQGNLYGIYRGYRVRFLNIEPSGFRVYKNPGNFDITRYYHRKGIYLKGYIKSEEDIISFGRASGQSALLTDVDKLREKFGIFVRSLLPRPENEIYLALTTGEKKGVPTDIRESFSSLGIAHIIAISGLHVGAVALMFYILIDWLLTRSEYLLLKFNIPGLTSTLTILPVALYMIVAGLATPVVRASVMLIVYLVSVSLGRHHNKLNTLGVAAFILLLWNPSSIYDLSFQLSFLSVLGILIMDYLYPLSFSSLRDKIITTLKCTIAASVFTTPLVINTFGTLPLLSVPCNIIMIPIVEFITVPACLLSFIIFNIHPALSKPLVTMNGYLIELLVKCADKLSGLSFSSLTIAHFSNLSIILCYITILLFAITRVRRKCVYLAATAVLIFIFSIYHRDKIEYPIITFPDAGNNIFSVVRLQAGKNILIAGAPPDGFGSGYIERYIISDYLLSSGIRKIDLMILLSNERNLLDGCAYLIDKFDVDYLISKDNRLTSDIWDKIYSGEIKKSSLESDAEPLVMNNTKLNFYINRNKISHATGIILKISYNNHSILITDYNGLDLGSIYQLGRNNKFKNADILYIPVINNLRKIDQIIDSIKPENLITREVKSRIKYKIESRNPYLKVYQTGKEGLISAKLKDNIYINSFYR